MPVISTGRYSTSSSSAASYLSPSGSTVGTYRSSYDSGRPSYSNYTSGTSSSAYRSTYSTYRSGLSDTHLTSSSRYGSSSSGYGVSRDKVSSLLPPTPPSSITNRRSESRQRDLISNNKDYTTTNSTLSSTLKTANSLNRLSRFGSSTGGVERSSSLARNLATCGVDLYEKYSPSTYVGPSSKSSYVPKTELTRSRSLSEASKFFVNNNNTPTLSNNSPYNNYISNNNNNNNNNNNSNDGTTAATTTTGDDVGSSGARNGEKLRGTSSLRNALPPTSSSSSLTNRSWDRDRDSGLSSSSSSAYRSTLGSRDYSDGYTSKRSSLLSSSIDRERKSSVTEHTEGLCGLWNIGNTCFMNSVVQCLSHTSELTKYLRNQSSGTRSSSSERKDQRIFNEFVKLIKEMWSASSRSVNPSEFKMALSSKYRMYSGSTQQDAQEFLRFFLDSLHTAMNTAQKADPVTLIDDMSDTKKADLMWDWYSKTENSVIKDLFVGQLRSTLKCSTCGNTSVTFDPFWDLSLPLPSNTRCKLENCLELFIKEEIMDGDEMPNCSKCKTRRKSTKTFTIQRFPKYLVIHLKRFSETRWSKLTNIVEFPTGERELNLAPYASDKTATCLYSLYGISNHMGSTAGGHYVAACKHASTKKWHEFNDNSVSDASESSLVSSSAYLLFFERV